MANKQLELNDWIRLDRLVSQQRLLKMSSRYYKSYVCLQVYILFAWILFIKNNNKLSYVYSTNRTEKSIIFRKFCIPVSVSASRRCCQLELIRFFFFFKSLFVIYLWTNSKNNILNTQRGEMVDNKFKNIYTYKLGCIEKFLKPKRLFLVKSTLLFGCNGVYRRRDKLALCLIKFYCV